MLELDSTILEAKSLKAEAEKRIKEGVSKEIREKTEQGLNAYKKGNYLKAVGVWNEILKLEPNNTTVQNYINKANQQMINEINEALNKLKNYILEGNLRAASNLLNRMLKKYPNQQNLTKQKLFIDQKIAGIINEYLNEGRKFFNTKEYIRAEKKFREVLEYEPKNNQAIIYLDKIKRETFKGKEEEADRYYLLGIDAYTKNNFELAVDYWEKVRAVNPNYPNVKKNLERARIKMSELNK